MNGGPMGKQIEGLQLGEALSAMERDGYRAHPQVRPGGQVRCDVCGRDFAAEKLAVLLESRVEGVSDPADETLVVGVRCPGCGSRGSLVLAYGPRAGRDDAAVMGNLGALQPPVR